MKTAPTRSVVHSETGRHRASLSVASKRHHHVISLLETNLPPIRMTDHQPDAHNPRTVLPMGRDEIQQRVATLSIWRHRIPLPHGVVTPGRDDCNAELGPIHLPADLTGQRVLDVGCSDGFFSFESERRGADVLGIDNFSSTPFNAGQNGFAIAKRVLKAKAEWLNESVYDLDPDRHGRFDLIIFLNTLYHLRHPLLGLEKMAHVLRPGGTMLLKTYFHHDVRFRRWGFDVFKRPVMRFFENDDLNDDPSNWWAPNRRCLEAMLRTSGFENLTRLGTYGDRIYYRCRRVE